MKNKIIAFKNEHPDLYNVITRALWTFLQAFVASIVIIPEMDKRAFWSMIIGAVGAGLSAIKTIIVEWLEKKSQRKEEGDA